MSKTSLNGGELAGIILGASIIIGSILLGCLLIRRQRSANDKMRLAYADVEMQDVEINWGDDLDDGKPIYDKVNNVVPSADLMEVRACM